MIIITILLKIIIIILFITALYCLYQLIRNQKIYRIRMKWIDKRNWHSYHKYSYNDMMFPCKDNWYGLKWPTERQYTEQEGEMKP